MTDGLYTVALRRDIGLAIRDGAEQLDGKAFYFTVGWIIEDQPHYAGETAMIPEDRFWPRNAPTWIASGDLRPAFARFSGNSR